MLETRLPRPLSRVAGYLPALFGAGLCVGLAAIAITLWAEDFRASGRVSDVMLVYVGAEDFKRITYREVKSPRLDEILNDENWPDDLRRYRNHLRRSDGVPLWLVVSDHEIVTQRFGATEWRTKVLPTIQSLLR